MKKTARKRREMRTMVTSKISDAIDENKVSDQPEFTANSGLNEHLPDDAKPIDYFDLFFTNELLNIISNQTNLFAQQTIDAVENMAPNSRMKSWRPTTNDEIKLFFGIIFSMGLTEKLDLQQYWSSDEVLDTPFFKKTMTKNRFLLLLRFLHFNDNTLQIPRGHGGYDPLFKIRPVYDYLRKRFKDLYTPEQRLSLDESTIGRRGNLHFRCYNPSKSHKFHIKVYVVCEATSGYACEWEIYSGKANAPPSEKGATYDLVMRLMEPYKDKGYILYMDNFYSSPTLFTPIPR